MTIRDRIETYLSDSDIRQLNKNLTYFTKSDQGDVLYAAIETIKSILKSNHIRSYSDAINNFVNYGEFKTGRKKNSDGLRGTLGIKTQ